MVLFSVRFNDVETFEAEKDRVLELSALEKPNIAGSAVFWTVPYQQAVSATERLISARIHGIVMHIYGGERVEEHAV